MSGCPGAGRLGAILGLTAVWWACAVAVTVILKAALGGAGAGAGAGGGDGGRGRAAPWSFPYPLTLTLFANIGTAAATGLLAAAANSRRCLFGSVLAGSESESGPGPGGPGSPRGHVLRVASREVLLCEESSLASRGRADSEEGSAADADEAFGAPAAAAARGHDEEAATELAGSSFLRTCCGSKPRRPTGSSFPAASLETTPDAGRRRVAEDCDQAGAVSNYWRGCRQQLAAVIEGGRATIAVVGLLQGLALALKNEALLLLSVSTRTMIFATNVLVVMLIARFCGLETLRRTKLVSALLLAAGGVLQGVATLQHMKSAGRSDSALGCLLAVLALLLDALRWVLLQAAFAKQDTLSLEPSTLEASPGHASPVTPSVLRTGAAPLVSERLARQAPEFSKFGMVSWVMWMSTPICLALSLVFEPAGLRRAWESRAELVGLVALLTLGVTGINLAEFGVVQWTSAVTFNVLCQLHSIPMVLAGVVCFGEEVEAVQVLGFAVCLLGAMLYSWAKAREKHTPHGLRSNEQEEGSFHQCHGMGSGVDIRNGSPISGH